MIAINDGENDVLINIKEIAYISFNKEKEGPHTIHLNNGTQLNIKMDGLELDEKLMDEERYLANLFNFNEEE